MTTQILDTKKLMAQAQLNDALNELREAKLILIDSNPTSEAIDAINSAILFIRDVSEGILND